MPATLQQKINRFRNWQDAERSLAGNLLLLEGLQAIGHPNLTLADVAYTEFQKPYFNNGISFNISHSGSFIICAISESHRVGVDVEAIMPIPIEDFNNLFAPSEWEEVTGAQDKFRAFYTLWTRKEAFLKVIGCGLSQPLNEVVIVNNKIEWDKEEWFLHEIKLDAGHIAYICCDHDSPQIKMKEIYL